MVAAMLRLYLSLILGVRMVSQEDLSAAEQAGVLTPEAVANLRNFVENRRGVKSAEEESFRLLTGFNDVFIVLASCLFLIALTYLVWGGMRIGGRVNIARLSLACIVLALGAWLLAEYFVKKKQLALPAIVLTALFVIGVAGLSVTFLESLSASSGVYNLTLVLLFALSFGLIAGLHWWRFRVPILPALSLGFLALLMLPHLYEEFISRNWAALLCGIAIFCLAVFLDSKDTQRKTRLSDTAFWLHLLAAPLVLFASFSLLDSTLGKHSGTIVWYAILIYVFFTLISLCIDRKAFMVSGVGFLLAAFVEFIARQNFQYSFAVMACTLGALLLLTAIFWQSLRRFALKLVTKSLHRFVPSV